MPRRLPARRAAETCLHRSLEGLPVGSPADLYDAVLGTRFALPLQVLLQAGFRILRRSVRIDARKPLLVDREHDSAGSLVAPVHEHRPEQGFERIRQDGRSNVLPLRAFTLPEADARADLQRARRLAQGFLANQRSPHARQLALRQIREARVQRLRHHAAEDAVTQEFEPLVVRRAVTAMRERLLEQRAVAKSVTDASLEIR
jgi:hypothetical protein